MTLNIMNLNNQSQSDMMNEAFVGCDNKDFSIADESLNLFNSTFNNEKYLHHTQNNNSINQHLIDKRSKKQFSFNLNLIGSNSNLHDSNIIPEQENEGGNISILLF
jgi:hypothetical protein